MLQDMRGSYETHILQVARRRMELEFIVCEDVNPESIVTIFRDGAKVGGGGKGRRLPPRISSRPPDILTPIFNGVLLFL